MSLNEPRSPEGVSPREFIVSAELYVPCPAALGLRKVCLIPLTFRFLTALPSPRFHAARPIAESLVNPSRMSPRNSKVRNAPHKP